ncbi:hypothetical protein A1Q2_04380 [Trichosporon asahii var. asahii CBS 8904]|uniref:Cytochrome c oxidase assembly factor 3 n=1 Tax=Trichosporon asahii var. asahii (strain CBS 8904) TaxID=1220162 RepID=K1VPA5_TRIAC|nr:hypothetical protein A1Q2_04380 [Trichosporon asahii var. asahii CBS 8904]
MNQGPTQQQVNNSYYPGLSEALKRARRPYQMRNLLTGGAVVAFILGVYAYSISAVKQDDFSDVVDLLPPAEERALVKTIEDEQREAEAARLGSTSTSSTPSSTSASSSSSSPSSASGKSGVASLLPRRLSDIEWVRQRGLVEPGRDNVLVWGAPSVDNIGNMRQNPGTTPGSKPL